MMIKKPKVYHKNNHSSKWMNNNSNNLHINKIPLISNKKVRIKVLMKT